MKFFGAILITLLIVQSSYQSPTVGIDIKAQVVALLQNVLAGVTKALDKADAVVAHVESDTANIEKEVVAFAVKEAGIINTFLLSELDKLREGASDAGKHVLDCIDAEKDQTETALSNTFSQVGKCAVPEVNKVTAEIKSILGQLRDLESDLDKEVSQLSACNVDDMQCLIAFAGDLVDILSPVPAAVKSDVKDIVALVKTILSDVDGCAKTTVNDAKANIQKIFNDGVTCMTKKL